MKHKLPAAALIAISLLGCNHDTGAGPDTEEAPQATIQSVGAPTTVLDPTLKLVREGNEFAVGESVDELFRVFGTPKPSWEFTDLPPGFQSPPYTARGWETAREGLGAIVYGDKVMAVMRQLSRSTSEQFNELVDEISKENPTVKPIQITGPPGSRVSYYFWEAPHQRIMVCGLDTRRDAWHITEALGDDTVLDALKVSPTQAQQDQPKVDSLMAASKG